MAAVWLRARYEIRTHLLSIVSLMLIAGIGGGISMAAVTGARRSDSAYPRFERETLAYDATVSTANFYSPYAQQFAILEQARKLPVVVDSDLLSFFFTAQVITPSGEAFSYPDVQFLADEEGKIGRTFERVKVISGRLFDPSHADEAITNPSVARALGVRVGDTLTIRLSPYRGSPVDVHVRLVGSVIAAGQVDSSYGGFVPLFFVTRAFFQKYGPNAFGQSPDLLVRLRHGAKSLQEFDAEAARAHLPVIPVSGQGDETQLSQAQGLARSTLFVAAGFRLFAGLVGVTVLLIVAQLLARNFLLDEADHRGLLALGMTRRQIAALAMIRAGSIAAGAVALASLTALLLSPLAPYGPTHVLELHPGLSADWLVFGLGGAVLLVSILTGALLPVARLNRSLRERIPSTRSHRPPSAELVTRLPAPMATGTKMALQPGRGATAVPVRTTIFGTATAMAALVAALCFGGSLHHLATTPSLVGWNWDAIEGGVAPASGLSKHLIASGIASTADVGWMGTVQVSGAPTAMGLAFDGGRAGPIMIAGRAPVRAGEIALGLSSLHAMRAKIGSTLPFFFEGLNANNPVNKVPVPLRVVGIFATPQTVYSSLGGGTGAVVSMADLRAISRSFATDDALFIRFAHGVGITSGVERLKNLIGSGPLVFEQTQATDQTNLQRVSGLPTVLGVLLALLAATTLAHTLVSSVRRRRRDLAILKTIGFTRSQIASTVAWQATTVIVIALAVGLPVGAAAGRLGWSAFALRVGFGSRPTVPLVPVLLSIPAALFLANAIAAFPARAAARTRAAEELHAE